MPSEFHWDNNVGKSIDVYWIKVQQVYSHASETIWMKKKLCSPARFSRSEVRKNAMFDVETNKYPETQIQIQNCFLKLKIVMFTKYDCILILSKTSLLINNGFNYRKTLF